ncbi:D-glycerate dehydrogenase [Candidatus Bipolaricaulota bacterium]|nr:D-glycerate dehydrogenase [Candidatus Bipolaricaulota bacterium]
MGIVVCTADLLPEHLKRLKDAGHEVRLTEDATPESLALSLADADGLICMLTNPIGAQVLDTAPHLRIVANVAVGYENIDLASATEMGIVVTNTPDVLTESTADHTFALLLASARRITEADTTVRDGMFPSWGLQQQLTGIDIHGKILGIVGMGRIGTAVARRGHHGFGMSILYHSRTRKPRLEDELGAQQLSFHELLAQSDFVCVHTPLTPDTRHLFNADALARMKPSAILVNVARGAVIDEEALVTALQKHIIAGAGLDVFEGEPQVHPDLLELREHIVLTPHVGSATEETRRAMGDMAIDNVIAVLAGKPPLTPVP